MNKVENKGHNETETIVCLSVLTFIIEFKFFNYIVLSLSLITECKYKIGYKNKKIRRMRILGARIFSKSFGGKIQNFQKVKTRKIFKKRRMRILNARIFFGGKFDN